MKAFIVALLVALPATLAAPVAEANASAFQSKECTCVNAAGETRASGVCQQQGGALLGSGSKDQYCHRATDWAPQMETIFNDASCASMWGAAWGKGVCRSVTLCEGPAAGYYQFC